MKTITLTNENGVSYDAKKEDVMKINASLSVTGCWKMVNAIQNGKTPQEVRERCYIAEKWLKANKVIDNDQYNDMMMTVTYLHRESYHTA